METTIKKEKRKKLWSNALGGAERFCLLTGASPGTSSAKIPSSYF